MRAVAVAVRRRIIHRIDVGRAASEIGMRRVDASVHDPDRDAGAGAVGREAIAERLAPLVYTIQAPRANGRLANLLDCVNDDGCTRR